MKDQPNTVEAPSTAGAETRGQPLVLVTGVTGYIGGRLVPELLDAGFRVRVLARKPAVLSGRPWLDRVEVAAGDVSHRSEIDAAMVGVDVVYYLIHALGTGSGFAAQERSTAATFGDAAARAGVRRIIYLGGLFPQRETLSSHLASRREVGEVLRASGVSTVILRAAIIIGSGSISFEMLRYLTERLPVMVTPKWVDTRIQPIAVRDVLYYLVGAAGADDMSGAFDIGGPDVLTYRQMMLRYARAAGVPRPRILVIPVLTPALSSHWVGLVTPVPGRIARPLVESLVNEVVCKEHDIAHFVADPASGLIGFDRAVELALKRIGDGQVSTSWSSAASPGAPSDPLPSDPEWAGGSLYVDDRAGVVAATPEQLWSVITGVGGRNGWYSWRLAWWARGLLDRIVGGPGLRRGRRDPVALSVGDALDWWRVETIEPVHLLRLRAEMRLPGLAWLELIVETDDEGRTVFRQRALFHPRGLAGHAYWISVLPFHGIVFGGMQRNIRAAASRLPRPEVPAMPQD
ncbi:MAG: SDR family oxidoreductase [Nakamurella sp.]